MFSSLDLKVLIHVEYAFETSIRKAPGPASNNRWRGLTALLCPTRCPLCTKCSAQWVASTPGGTVNQCRLACVAALISNRLYISSRGYFRVLLPCIAYLALRALPFYSIRPFGGNEGTSRDAKRQGYGVRYKVRCLPRQKALTGLTKIRSYLSVAPPAPPSPSCPRSAVEKVSIKRLDTLLHGYLCKILICTMIFTTLETALLFSFCTLPSWPSKDKGGVESLCSAEAKRLIQCREEHP
jgi:hypothetical protein